MATAAMDVRDGGVSIGRILQRGFGTIGDNPVVTLGIALLFSALPSALITYASQQIRGPMVMALGYKGVIALALVTMLLAIVFAMLTQGALVRATAAHAEGRRASFAESVMAGMTMIVPLFLLSLVIGFGVSLASIFFLIPGIILYVMWSVASPALVEERFGVSSAISRSNYLTKGARWRVFAIQLIMVAMIYLVAGAVALIASAVYGGFANFMAASANGRPIWYLALDTLSQTVTAAVWATTQAALYLELRDWKDGPQTDTLAEVFA
jgi:uncharacterized membrane protein